VICTANNTQNLTKAVAKILAEEKTMSQHCQPKLKQCLQQADCDVFTNTAVLLKIAFACTLPVGSCEAERSFSCFRKIKSFLHNNMREDRVSGYISITNKWRLNLILLVVIRSKEQEKNVHQVDIVGLVCMCDKLFGFGLPHKYTIYRVGQKTGLYFVLHNFKKN